jgi:hypothetical protein
MFQSSGFSVDYLHFNLAGRVDKESLEKLAGYLFHSLNINSTYKFADSSVKTFYEKKGNFMTARFIPTNQKYWVGTILVFSSSSAEKFYLAIQNQKVNWKHFDLQNVNLGRIDLCYNRAVQPFETTKDLELFMEQSCQKAQAEKVKANWTRNQSGLIMRIGSRKTGNLIRVYTKTLFGKRYLRFEVELKREYARTYQSLLFENRIEDFETEILKHIYKRLLSVLDLTTNFTDWLLPQVRKFPKTPTSCKSGLASCLVLSYLQGSLLSDTRDCQFFFQWLLLLSFIHQHREAVKDYPNLEDQVYYKLSFRLSAFLEFQHINPKNYYKASQVVEHLKKLQQIPTLVSHFADGSFRSIGLFPQISVGKIGKSWYVEILMVEELYNYKYPFFLPPSLLSGNTSSEVRTKIAIFQALATSDFQKQFVLDDLLQQVGQTNQNKARVKQHITNP